MRINRDYSELRRKGFYFTKSQYRGQQEGAVAVFFSILGCGALILIAYLVNGA